MQHNIVLTYDARVVANGPGRPSSRLQRNPAALSSDQINTCNTNYMKQIIKHILSKSPTLEGVVKRTYRSFASADKRSEMFPGSEQYWEERYSSGANSGAGSYGLLAEFKADVLNAFVTEHDVQTVIEFGCGDGNQLRLATYNSYLGFDVSQTAVDKCKELFKSDPRKSFRLVSEYKGEKADLAISLDVIYHLVEDAVFDEYMRMLFSASNAYVIVYSSNHEQFGSGTSAHVRHRKFTSWVEDHLGDWQLAGHVPNRYPYSELSPNGSFAEFYIFRHLAQPIVPA